MANEPGTGKWHGAKARDRGQTPRVAPEPSHVLRPALSVADG